MLTKNKKSNQFKELSDKSKLEKPLTVCSCHVTYAFQSESTLYSCLNVKNSLLEADAKSEGEVTATVLEPRTN